MSTITTVNLKKSFEDGLLYNVIQKLIFWEQINYEWEQSKENIFVNGNQCRIYVDENIIKPFLDTEECKSILSEEIKSNNYNIYDKNMILKKIHYFNTILRLKKEIKIYNQIIQINWYAFELNDYSAWNNFMGSLKGINLIHEVKNTRAEKGYKPYKISSKIIFNRNG